MKNTIKVLGLAPYAVSLPNGRELSQGEVARVEPSEAIDDQIRTGVLGLIEESLPTPPKTTPRKSSETSLEVPATSTEGEL